MKGSSNLCKTIASKTRAVLVFRRHRNDTICRRHVTKGGIDPLLKSDLTTITENLQQRLYFQRIINRCQIYILWRRYILHNVFLKSYFLWRNKLQVMSFVKESRLMSEHCLCSFYFLLWQASLIFLFSQLNLLSFTGSLF